MTLRSTSTNTPSPRTDRISSFPSAGLRVSAQDQPMQLPVPQRPAAARDRQHQDHYARPAPIPSRSRTNPVAPHVLREFHPGILIRFRTLPASARLLGMRRLESRHPLLFAQPQSPQIRPYHPAPEHSARQLVERIPLQRLEVTGLHLGLERKLFKRESPPLPLFAKPISHSGPLSSSAQRRSLARAQSPVRCTQTTAVPPSCRNR